MQKIQLQRIQHAKGHVICCHTYEVRPLIYFFLVSILRSVNDNMHVT